MLSEAGGMVPSLSANRTAEDELEIELVYLTESLSAKQVVVMNMIQNCSISENIKVDDSGDCDRLSELPLSIIHIILAFIPIRDAVRTSVLSTQWRYTWTTLSQLEFDNECVNQEYESAFTYGDIISQVLLHHNGPIHKFRMHFQGIFRNVDEWILCLWKNDSIRELILVNSWEPIWAWAVEKLEMHSGIYSCEKLTYLKLCGCELDPPPLNFKGFLFLRFLSLGMVNLSPDEIYSLVAACPLLESFELTETNELELKISAPNLKYMQFKGHHRKICINAPLMTEISVALIDIKGPDQQLNCSACDYAKCFGGFTNLQKLFGSRYFIKYLSLGIELCHQSLVFHHLKLIDLDYVDFEDVKQILVIAHLVIGAPKLQELKIRIKWISREDDESDSEAPHLFFKGLGCASSFKLEKLTDVSLSGVHGLTLEVEFLKFLLESSPVLETMRVELVRHDTEENRNNLRAKLEGCNWASPTVKLW